MPGTEAGSQYVVAAIINSVVKFKGARKQSQLYDPVDVSQSEKAMTPSSSYRPEDAVTRERHTGPKSERGDTASLCLCALGQVTSL